MCRYFSHALFAEGLIDYTHYNQIETIKCSLPVRCEGHSGGFATAIPGRPRASDGLSHRGKERLQFFQHLAESREVELLLAIAQCFRRMRMHLHEQAVRSERHGAAAHRPHQVRPAAALAGIDDDGEVRFLLDDRDGGEVESVARVGLEGADAALAEQDVRVALGKDVTRRP